MIASKELPRFVRDLLSSPPPRGGGLNNWLYRVARVLHPYRPDDEIISLLQAATAGERVKYGEIERAVERSRATAWQPGQSAALARVPAWPRINTEQREAITATGLGLVEAWEVSPVRFEDKKSRAEEIIDVLFPGNPLLCVGQSSYDFSTCPRQEWRGRLAKKQLIVPSPMSATTGTTKDGRLSEHSLANTGPRRFLIIEQDMESADEQAAVLLHLAERWPLALAVHSGGKSLHGWFYCHGQSEDRLRRFMRYAVVLGADPATWTRSQFVRMPDGTRENGERQTVYFFNPAVIR
jgi:hypothetical protein